MNLVRSVEYSRLGLYPPNARELIYQKLVCSDENVHRFHEGTDPESPLYAMRFCINKNSSYLLGVADEDGAVHIHDTRPYISDNNKLALSFQAHNKPIFDLNWTENDAKLLTSSGDHTAVLWDLAKGVAVPVFRLIGHQGSVKAIACKPGDPHIFATCARDGEIRTWDIRSQYLDAPPSSQCLYFVLSDQVIRCAHLKRGAVSRKNVERSECLQSVSSVIYQDETALISCSSTDKVIKIWDTRKTYSAFKGVPAPVHALNRQTLSNVRLGYTSLAISPCRLKLYAYCTNSCVYAYDIGTYRSDPIMTYKSSGASSFFCKLNISPDGRFLSTGSSDGKGYILSVARPDSPLVALEGHAAEVSCVDWCRFGELKLASCSDDGTYRIWTVRPKGSNVQGGTAVPETVVKSSKNIYFQSHIKEATWRRRASSSLQSSPNKCARSPKKPRTPKKLEVFLSDLPNYNVDGRSPHEPRKGVTSPAPEDWLRRLIASTPPTKPTSAKKNRRPSSASKPRARDSLLRYFKKNEEPVEEAKTAPDPS